MAKKDKIAIFTTVSSEDVALQIAQELMGQYLAACVNIIPKVHSVYRWQGEVVDDHESMLIIKTRIDKFAEVKDVIKAVGGYEVPEVLYFKIENGAKEFLDWIDVNLEIPDKPE